MMPLYTREELELWLIGQGWTQEPDGTWNKQGLKGVTIGRAIDHQLSIQENGGKV